VLGYPYAVGDRVAKAMPPLVLGRDTPLYACLDRHPKHEDGYKMAAELRQMYAADPDAKAVIDVAKGIENLRRQDGIHAAAVVITPEPLTEYLPIQRKPENGGDPEAAPIVTQYEMHGVEELGLLKMDFLGLRNLDVISDTVELIRHARAIDLDIDAIPLDDAATFEMLRRGDGIGVFQLEGAPLRQLMQRLAPTTFEDVCALVALYRPGPMAANMHNEYADRKNGRKRVDYLHPDAAELLEDTYGLCIYQESVMRVAEKFAGYSLAESDNLRKACGKKIRALIAQEREKFVAGCERTGYGSELGERWFAIIEPFADYAFNKSHAFGYGLIAYQTAYLKANYPVEYLAALLSSVKTNLDKAAVYLAECRNLGITVQVPDINLSQSDFTAMPETSSIVFGLSAVRNVGAGLVRLIIDERDANGPFADFNDFCERVDPSVLNKRMIEALIKAGAFDSFGVPRKGLLVVFEQLVDQTLARRRERDLGIMSLFGDGGGADGDGRRGGAGFDERIPIPDLEFDRAQRLAFEKEMLGLYVSDHPLMGVTAALRRRCDCSVAELREAEEGSTRTCGGVVTGLQRKWTKRGELMAVFTLEDLESAIEVMVFPKTMTDHGHKLADDTIVVIRGRIDTRDEQPKLVAVEIEVVEGLGDAAPPLRIRLTPQGVTDGLVARLKGLFEDHPGDSKVFVHLGERQVLRLPDRYCVDVSRGLVGELRELLGSAAIRV
jgi:DNA polymerase-3 subunit alpha